MLIVNSLSHLDENSYGAEDISYLAGLVLSEFGLYLVKEILISEPVELTYSESTHSLQNTISTGFYITTSVPRIDKEVFQFFADIYFKMGIMERDDKNDKLLNRIKLSLNWYLQSVDTKGVNKFISIWIALEALILNGSTDLNIVKQAICNIYHIPLNKVEASFFIGRLFSLRGNIVHKGMNTGMSHVVIAYLSNLYHDLLYHSLKLPTNEYAKEYISKEEHYKDLTNYFKVALQ